MTDPVLILLLNGRRVGEVRRNGQKLSLHYDPAWRADPAAYPVSLSMPLASLDHSHAAITAFVWGLLPDNEQVLDRWARQFHVSARNPFALIGAVGEDCAGAVQFVTPERADALMQGGEDDIQWLDDDQIEDRLRTLRQDQAAWRDRRDHGQFSLAGAQPKTALLRQDGRWGVPSGPQPHEPYPEAAHRRLRRSGGKRAFLPPSGGASPSACGLV
ncbi:HipA N-terminal domain-containing protein [Brevundimonas sp.]|uniref:HipA N-terminal domain-containing protein n=1 Tax=Brevundimonas sp. TaxID=1871086 RepID=UPI0028A1825C|nr:HipA N-terminal domain-containing protein [Brevundimonas sp.]